jgi:hypothetical protein
MSFPYRCLTLALVLVAVCDSCLSADERPRLLVLTDIGGDPDDTQSLIRLLLYNNELQIEGLIATASGTPGELKEAVTRADLIRQTIEVYGQVQGNLAKHDPRYPPADELLKLVKSGNPNRGIEAVGEGQDTEGSRWIIAAVDRQDERPLNITIWGGQTDFAQALWRVRKDRGEDGLSAFVKKIRVYDISDQDRIQPWIFENFPDIFYVLAKAPPGGDKREGCYRGVYLGGDESLTSLEWLNEHVRKDHGPLGALYPSQTWTEPNPHGAMKEGDTPSWFFFLTSGLSDPAHPEWGGWGGRFKRVERGLWRDQADTVGGKTEPRATVYRWRPAFQAELRARMDWCVKSPDEANHAPRVAIHGDSELRPLIVKAKAGEMLKLDLAESEDRDGDNLAFRAWVYPEAGTYRGKVALQEERSSHPAIAIPKDAAGKSIHVILEALDDGQPALTTQRRAVIEVE